MRKIEEKYLKIGKFKIRYLETGTGYPLIFVHCWSGAAENWVFTLKNVFRHFRSIALDLPGYGKSSKFKNVNYSIDFYSDILLQMMDKLNLKKVYLAGNSMGGNISLVTTLKASHKIEKLVLVDSAGVTYIPEVVRLCLGELIKKLGPYLRFYKPPAWMIKTIIRWAFYKPLRTSSSLAQDIVEYIQGNNYRIWTEAIYKTAHSIITTNLREDIKKIDIPVLIVWGKHDRVLFFEDALYLHYNLRNSKLVVFENCGHFPHIECPAEFNRTLMDFLLQK